jgi:MFS family permease
MALLRGMLASELSPRHLVTPSPRQALWRWVALAVAALAMVATLPGRTHGLGLITSPLLRDLHLGQVPFADINLWATLLGAAFCVPVGWLLDRLGARLVLGGTLLALGGVVVVMSRTDGDWVLDLGDSVVRIDLFVLVLLTRGLGQSGLSVVSLALMGKAAGPKPGPAVGVYSFLVAAGFMGAFALIQHADQAWHVGWRDLWAGIGYTVLATAPVCWLLVRPAKVLAPLSRQGRGVGGEGGAPDPSPPAPLPPGERGENGAVADDSLTLGQALRTPAFWVFALATSLYGLIAAGVSLFNQAILEEREFNRDVFLTVTTVTPLIGLAGNLSTGWLATRFRLGRLLAVALAIVASALLAFPLVETLPHVYAYAAAMGFAGGMVTVLFFAVWGLAYGPTHLGQIQGAAQMLTVLASAVGPLALAVGKERFGSYVPTFQILAAACLVLAAAAWFVRLPRRGEP